MPEYYDGYWFRCKRCRKAVYKLKNLMIRHLSLTHSIHRFDMETRSEGADDWERVLVKEGGEIEKVELPVTPPKPILHMKIETRKPTPPTQSSSSVQNEKQAQVPKAKEEKEDEGARQPPKHQYQNRHKMMDKQKNMDNWLAIGIEEEQEGQQYVKTDPIISQTFYSVLENNPVTEPTAMMTEQGIMSSSVEEYRCRYCDAPFVHSKSRGIHEAKVHNEEFDGYTCQVCFRNFTTITSVQDHYRCTHKMTPPIKKAWKSWRINGTTDLDDYVQAHILSEPQIEAAQGDHHAPRTCEIQATTSTNEIINLVVSDQNFSIINSQGGEQLEECIVEEDNQQYSLNETYYFHPETGTVIPISLIPNPSTTILTEPSIQQFNNSIQQTQVVTAVKSEADPPISEYFSTDELSLPPKKKLKRSATFTSPPEASRVNVKIEPDVVSPPPSSTITSESYSAADQFLAPVHIDVIRQRKESPPKYQRYSCPKNCNEKFRTQWEQILHLAKSHSEYICEFCNLTFSQKRDMIEHQYSSHNTESGHYQCRFCTLHHFTNPLMVQEHVYFFHKEQRVPSISVVAKWRRA